MKLFDVGKGYYLTGKKIRIFETPEQRDKFFKTMVLYNRIRNWGVNVENDIYQEYLSNNKKGKKCLSVNELMKKFQYERDSNPECLYFKEIPTHTAKGALCNARSAFDYYFAGLSEYPSYKSIFDYPLSFRVRGDSCFIKNGRLSVEGFRGTKSLDIGTHIFDGYGYNGVKHPFCIPMYKPTIVYNGDYFEFGFSFAKPKNHMSTVKTDVIGIDLGSINTFTLSTGEVFQQPDCSREEKAIEHLDKLISEKNYARKQEAERLGVPIRSIPKSNNLLELETRRREKYRRIHNKKYYFYDYITTMIIRRNPMAICIEYLLVKDMISSRPEITKDISRTYFCMIRLMIEYKCNKNNILLLEADANYPSSKKCCECGFIYKSLGSKREYKCPKCGNIKPRDLNASLNLKNLYYEFIEQKYENLTFKWIEGYDHYVEDVNNEYKLLFNIELNHP